MVRAVQAAQAVQAVQAVHPDRVVRQHIQVAARVRHHRVAVHQAAVSHHPDQAVQAPMMRGMMMSTMMTIMTGIDITVTQTTLMV